MRPVMVIKGNKRENQNGDHITENNHIYNIHGNSALKRNKRVVCNYCVQPTVLLCHTPHTAELNILNLGQIHDKVGTLTTKETAKRKGKI